MVADFNRRLPTKGNPGETIMAPVGGPTVVWGCGGPRAERRQRDVGVGARARGWRVEHEKPPTSHGTGFGEFGDCTSVTKTINKRGLVGPRAWLSRSRAALSVPSSHFVHLRSVRLSPPAPVTSMVPPPRRAFLTLRTVSSRETSHIQLPSAYVTPRGPGDRDRKMRVAGTQASSERQ